MSKRHSLLVGSLPFSNEEEAMNISLEILGESLLCLPDGEIGKVSDEYPKGSRSSWIMTVVNILSADKENWEIVKERGKINEDWGFQADYSEGEKIKPKRSPSDIYEHLYFGYHDYFNESYPIFKKLRDTHNRPELKFLVGVPTGLGITFSVTSPITALRYAKIFNKRIAYEINKILKVAKDDVIIQIEVPGEFKMASTLPSFLMKLAIRSINSLISMIDKDAQVGIHICLGDLNNIALTSAKSLKKMVKFSNLLVDSFSQDHRLIYVHYPLAEGRVPPPTNREYYEPLRNINLPEGTHFFSGSVHEGLSTEENLSIIKIIDDIRGSNVGIASSCGLGRRPRDVGKYILEETNKLSKG